VPITSDEIKATVASYWRYVRQCPVIALEVNSNLSGYAGEETADVMAVDKNRCLIETEVKLNLADMKRDIKKAKHRDFGERRPRCVARYFYFAVPKGMANDAKLMCDDFYPYAGVLGTDSLSEWSVEVYRKPRPLPGKRLSYSQALRLIFSQSGTVCRLAKKVEELLRVQRNLEAQLKEYRDMERLR
jgi:hypothetical protein